MSTDAVARQLAQALQSAIAAQAAGRPGEAVPLFESALQAQPDNAVALNGLGACLAQTGQLPRAIAVLERASRCSEGIQAGYALANLGSACLAAQRPGEALRALDGAVRHLPGEWNLHVLRANLLASLGHQRQALDAFSVVLQAMPQHGAALTGRGILRRASGDLAGAHADFAGAARVMPADPAAHFHHGVALQDLGRFDDCVLALGHALRLQPGHADALLCLGEAYRALGDPDQALAALDRAVQLRPDHAHGLSCRANLHAHRGELHEALHDFDAAISLAPGNGGYHLLRGDVLRKLLRHAEAVDGYERGLRLAPDDPNAGRFRFHLGFSLLVCGELERGWDAFEARWSDPALQMPHAFPPERQWDGHADLAGRTLLVHAEQGLGDTLQFCRYLPALHARGARIIFEVPVVLHRLLAALPCPVHLPKPGEPMVYDLHIPLLSTPRALRTGLASIPAATPYLRAPAGTLQHWSARLQEGPRAWRTAPPRLRVGVAWSGNPAQGNDAARSMRLCALQPLIEGPLAASIDWIGLQRDVRGEDADLLARLPLRHLGNELGDFADTAAVMAQLDLVISVDTSVAHLAGALARPVWILLCRDADWRWLLDRSDCPWYPSARLFRQRTVGDWDDVVGRVAVALAAEVDRHRAGAKALS